MAPGGDPCDQGWYVGSSGRSAELGVWRGRLDICQCVSGDVPEFCECQAGAQSTAGQVRYISDWSDEFVHK